MDRAELARLLGTIPRVMDGASGPHIIEEAHPVRFTERFTAAVAAGGPVFLADPAWSGGLREEMKAALAKTDHGDATPSPRLARKPRREHVGPSKGKVRSGNADGWLMIPSGGTSGRLKFARHDELTIEAAVRGFCTHLGLTRINAVGVLPLHHVSGLMAWMRCALTGGEYLPWEWKRLEVGERPVLRGEPWVFSLVPTQLQRLMSSPAALAWLRGFHAIFVGGGPIWPELADAAATARLRISPSYGMTETAAMISALRPEEFLAGARSSGAIMPHAQVRIDPVEGVVSIAGESVFRGHWPEWSDAGEFMTEDIGRLDERGHLHVLGRRDALIITGGKKVQPADVEAALRASGEFADVAVIGVPDPEWGEVVVACYPGTDSRARDLTRAVERLAAFQRPKRFVALADWPRNAQGKVNRAALRAAVERG